MAIRALFEIELSDWELKMVCAGILFRIDIEWSLFEREAQARMQNALDRLKTVPETWARDLSLEELLS